MGAIQQLKSKLITKLPGLEAQMPLSPVRKEAARYYDVPASAKNAAVMCLMHEKKDGWHITFIRRASHDDDHHSGQISFPGGRKNDNDSDFLDCALRETVEEIGIGKDQIELLGPLSPLYVYASHHFVQPYVGLLRQEPKYIIDPREVDQVIEAPISLLKRKDVIKYTDMNIRGFILKNVPYYDLYGEVLWGATAMMTSELIYLWK